MSESIEYLRDSNTEITETSLLQLIESIPAPVFFKDRGGRYLGCNCAFENFLGIPRDRFIGCTVYDISPPDLADIYFRADQALYNTGGVQIYETSICKADGHRRNVVFNKAVFTSPNGRVGGLVGVIIDVTERGVCTNPQWGVLDYILPENNREIYFLQLLAPHLHGTCISAKNIDDNRAKKSLSQREQDVLKWVCWGKTNSEIGSILGISSWTVKVHVANLLEKLNASTRGHAATKAISLGLIEINANSRARANK